MEKSKAASLLEATLKVLVKSSLIVFVAAIASKVLVYVYRAIIARSFGPEVFGYFSLATMVTSVAIALATFGLIEGLLRFVPYYLAKNDQKAISVIVNFSNKALAISGIVTAVIVFFGAEVIAKGIFDEPGLVPFLQIFAFSIPAMVLAEVALSIIRGYERIGLHSLISLLSHNIFKIAFLVLFLFFSVGELAIAYSYVAGILGMLVLSIIALRSIGVPWRLKKDIPNKESKVIRLSLLHYSIPLLFAAFFGLLFNWIDTFSLGFYKSAVEVGLYNAAIPLALLLAIIPEVFIKLLFPIMNREFSNKNSVVIQETTKQVNKWIFIVNLPLLLILFVFAEAALNIVFGSEFIAAAPALRVLVFSSFISALLGIIPYRVMAMAGKSKKVLVYTSGGAVLNLVLNSVFVPQSTIFGINNALGIVGAAFSTLIATTFIGLAFLFESRKILGAYVIRRKMANAIFAMIPSGIFLIYAHKALDPGMWVMGGIAIICVAMYVGMLFICKALDKNDKMVLTSMFTKVKSED